MSATDFAKEKLLIIDWVLRQDNSQNLKTLSDIINRLEKESAESVRIIGYRAKGIPITLNQLISAVKDSLDEIQRGEEISLDKLEHESDQW
jgi:hypothetical protein